MPEPSELSFDELPYERPDLDAVEATTGELAEAFEHADSVEEESRLIESWDEVRSRLWTQKALARVHYHQDTRDEAAEAENDFWDEASPRLTAMDVQRARTLLGSPRREELAEVWGPQAFRLAETTRDEYGPEIADDLADEARLSSRYTRLLASAELEFRGETLNLSEMAPHYEDPDRETRKEARETAFGFLADHADELDEIFDRLVDLRDGMGRALGFDGFVPLAYRRMSRTDYGPEDVAVFRDEIRERVVPVATELRARQRERLGLDELMYWDEALQDPRGNPQPEGDGEWVLERAREMYEELHPETGRFFERMLAQDLIDWEARKGKAPGGFCSYFAAHRLPFIFASFNGTRGDVRVLTHEVGHAFQGWMSRDVRLVEYLYPTMEACEIHSMAMEFLTWPWMDRFFGDDADRQRRQHLEGALKFLPYAAAVDEFQHRIYEEPELEPADRKEIWREMERTYLPHRDHGDLPHVREGGFWQRQRHVYASPFYYIDYALAQTCALQMWERAQADREDALQAYLAVCRPGGSLPFSGLVEVADLTSPFEEGCLAGVVDRARSWLGLGLG